MNRLPFTIFIQGVAIPQSNSLVFLRISLPKIRVSKSPLNKDSLLKSPLRIRGIKGVILTILITPLTPLILRGVILEKLTCFHLEVSLSYSSRQS